MIQQGTEHEPNPTLFGPRLFDSIYTVISPGFGQLSCVTVRPCLHGNGLELLMAAVFALKQCRSQFMHGLLIPEPPDCLDSNSYLAEIKSKYDFCESSCR